MRKLRRIIFNFNASTILSLTLCVAKVWFWTRDFRHGELLGAGHGRRALWVGSEYRYITVIWANIESRGGNFGSYMDEQGRPFDSRNGSRPFSVFWWSAWLDDLSDLWTAGYRTELIEAPKFYEWHGIVYRHARMKPSEFNFGPVQYFPSQSRNGSLKVTGIIVPCWMLAITLTLLPAIWLVRYRLAKTHDTKGHCGRCGYDLRATPERCPEFGSVPQRVNS